MSARLRALSLTALLTSSGVIHFVRPETFTDLVPSWVPGTPRQVIYLSGAAELMVAALVAAPRTRRVGGLAAVALFIGVFPGNIKMALDAANSGGSSGPGSTALAVFAWVRLPLQIPLVLWARRIAREAHRSDRSH